MASANVEEWVDDDSVKQIIRKVEEITKSENLLNKGQGFIYWILENYFELDRENAASSVIDSPNDKGLDAFIEDDESLKIIQCKFFEDPQKKVGSNEIAVFKGCVDWLKNPEEVKKLNIPRFYDIALTFSDRWNEGVEVELHFFAFGRFSSEAEKERIVFNNNPDIRGRLQMYFHDVKEIIALYKSITQEENPLVNERIEIELIPNEYFVKRGNMPSVVATIKGKDLLKMYKKYGDELFERNIRFYRGARKGSINAKIIDTILNNTERPKFWYYNNGISFVCRDFSLKDDTNPPILEVHGFQIINGCQTTVCLSEAMKQIAGGGENIPDEVQIVVRFIKAPVGEVDLITLYTNSQNPVSEIQLRSNDSTQKRLKDELAEKYSYFYSIKEGDWKRLSTTEKRNFGDRIIKMSDAAQAIYSFTADPAFARRWKIKLFSEKYNKIFKKDISAEEILLPWRILQVIRKRISKYRREELNKFKKEPSSFTTQETDEIKKKEFLIYSDLIILYFIGKLIQKRYRQYSPAIAKKLLNNKLEQRIEKIFDYIVGILKFSDKLKQETLTRFLKNFDNITSLYDEIQKAIEMDRARFNEDPLDDMLPEINLSNL